MSCEKFREQIPECMAGRPESGAADVLIYQAGAWDESPNFFAGPDL